MKTGVCEARSKRGASEKGLRNRRLAATDDLEQERERLDQHWQKRLERAAHQANRAERQFQAVEPENRLVARTLEKKWEEALREQTQLKIEYEDFRRIQPTQLDDEQRTLVRQLSQDIPTLWNVATTSAQDRQRIVRMLIDRIELKIEGNTERTEIILTWAGGFTSRHQHNRTVISYAQLSNLNEMLARIIELKETCATLGEVANQINNEGYRSLRRRTFTGAMISRLLVKQGIHSPRNPQPPEGVLQENEWWISDLAKRLGMPKTSLWYWRKSGWINGRKLPGLRGRWIIWADESEIARLEKLRAARRRWSDCPFPSELTTPKSNAS